MKDKSLRHESTHSEMNQHMPVIIWCNVRYVSSICVKYQHMPVIIWCNVRYIADHYVFAHVAMCPLIASSPRTHATRLSIYTLMSMDKNNGLQCG